MILKDDKGTFVDYFWEFPNYKNIGLSLSGGMDSALILWCLVEMLRGRQHLAEGAKIWCMHGYDINRTKTHSYEAAQRVLDWVKWHQKDNTFIQPLHVFAYHKTRADQSKMQFHKPNERSSSGYFSSLPTKQLRDITTQIAISNQRNAPRKKQITLITLINNFL